MRNSVTPSKIDLSKIPKIPKSDEARERIRTSISGSGSKVAPGLYLFRVEADLDTGNETKSGVIAVAY